MKSENHPFWINAGILPHCLAFAGPGLDQRGCPPQASPLWPVTRQGVRRQGDGAPLNFGGGFLRGCQCSSL